MASIRQKHNQVAEELNNQLDQVKKNKKSVGISILFSLPLQLDCYHHHQQ